MTEKIEGKVRTGKWFMPSRLIGQKVKTDESGQFEINARGHTIWVSGAWCVIPNEKKGQFRVTSYGVTEKTNSAISMNVPLEGALKISGQSFNFECQRVKGE